MQSEVHIRIRFHNPKIIIFFPGLVASTSEPVSLQPSLSKSAETSQDPAKQVNPLKPAFEQLNPPNFVEQSSSSLMEASCESEILELELNSKLENSRLEIDDASSADISVGLVSVSDDQSKCEESKVDTTVVEGEQDSSIKFDVKNFVEEEANQISTLAQGKKICHDLLFVDIVRIQMRSI